MTPPRIFVISPHTWKLQQKMNVSVFANLAATVFVFLFFVVFVEDQERTFSSMLYATLCIGAAAVAFVRHHQLARYYKEQWLLVAGKCLYHKKNNAILRLEHRNITRIVITEKENGEFAELRLFTKNGMLVLSGFENMQRLFDTIKEHMHELVVIRRQRIRTTANSWLWLNASLTLAACIIIALYVYVPPVFIAAQYAAFAVAGVMMWAKKPLSKVWGKRMRMCEFVLGALLLALLGSSMYR